MSRRRLFRQKRQHSYLSLREAIAQGHQTYKSPQGELLFLTLQQSEFEHSQQFRMSDWELGDVDREVMAGARLVCIDPQRDVLAAEARKCVDEALRPFRFMRALRSALAESETDTPEVSP